MRSEQRLRALLPSCDPDAEFEFIRIEGESLIGDHIQEGDVLTARLHFQPSDLWPGRLVVIECSSGFIVGHVFIGIKGQLRLVKNNPCFEDLIFEPGRARVVGIIIRSVRYFDDYDDGPGQDYGPLTPCKN